MCTPSSTPQRAKLRELLRNVAAPLGNWGSPEPVPGLLSPLELALDEPSRLRARPRGERVERIPGPRRRSRFTARRASYGVTRAAAAR
jgi:hypothetical protein